MTFAVGGARMADRGEEDVPMLALGPWRPTGQCDLTAERDETP